MTWYLFKNTLLHLGVCFQGTFFNSSSLKKTESVTALPYCPKCMEEITIMATVLCHKVVEPDLSPCCDRQSYSNQSEAALRCPCRDSKSQRRDGEQWEWVVQAGWSQARSCTPSNIHAKALMRKCICFINLQTLTKRLQMHSVFWTLSKKRKAWAWWELMG